jgi:hypothetical protein
MIDISARILEAIASNVEGKAAPILPPGPSRMSVDCFRVWARTDPEGLAAWKKRRGGLIVRVPVPRQRWPNSTMV